MKFDEYCKSFETLDKQTVTLTESVTLSFINSKGEEFNIKPADMIGFLRLFHDNYDEVRELWNTVGSAKDITKYDQNSYRAIYKYSENNSDLKIIKSTGSSQTKPLTMVFSKLIAFLSGQDYKSVDENTFYDKQSIAQALSNEHALLVSNNSSCKKKTSLFNGWLIANGASQRTADSYSVTSVNTINNFIDSYSLPHKKLYDLILESEVDALKASLATNS